LSKQEDELLNHRDRKGCGLDARGRRQRRDKNKKLAEPGGRCVGSKRRSKRHSRKQKTANNRPKILYVCVSNRNHSIDQKKLCKSTYAGGGGLLLILILLLLLLLLLLFLLLLLLLLVLLLLLLLLGLLLLLLLLLLLVRLQPMSVTNVKTQKANLNLPWPPSCSWPG
jgi:Flp pilus assembly protein TadB